MPGHVAIGDQLTVDVASDLGVPPAVVDMDDADHVPLKVVRKHRDCKLKETFQTKGWGQNLSFTPIIPKNSLPYPFQPLNAVRNACVHVCLCVFYGGAASLVTMKTHSQENFFFCWCLDNC